MAQTFRDRIRDAASRASVNILTNLGTTCQYSARSGAPISLVCWSGRVQKNQINYVKTISQNQTETFWIPRQTNFPPPIGGITCSDTITDTDGNTFRILDWENRDGVGAIFTIRVARTIPKQVGDVD